MTRFEDYTVAAEDAPLGVQLWPTVTPAQAPHFTLAKVTVVRSLERSYVEWTYEGGTTRTFKLGEEVVCRRPVEKPAGAAPFGTMTVYATREAWAAAQAGRLHWKPGERPSVQ